MNLRARIRKVKICCVPWCVWRGEIDYLPISSKTLFARRGMEIDVLEMALKSEGFLYPDETLLEVLKEPVNLHRVQLGDEDYFDNSTLGEFPSNWTEEDYKYFYGEN